MTDNPTAIPTEDAGDAEPEAMERYGITRVSTAVYIVGPYRYSKFADALTEAD